MDLVNHLDFWLMVVTFAFLFYYFVWKKIEHWTWVVLSWIIWSIISAFRGGHEIMSNEGDFEEGEKVGISTSVPDTQASERGVVPTLGTSLEPVPESAERDITISRHMPPSDLIVLLASLQDDDGEYVYSANVIAGFVKGKRRNDILDLIREVREPVAASRPAPVFRELNEKKQPIM